MWSEPFTIIILLDWNCKAWGCWCFESLCQKKNNLRNHLWTITHKIHIWRYLWTSLPNETRADDILTYVVTFTLKWLLLLLLQSKALISVSQTKQQQSCFIILSLLSWHMFRFPDNSARGQLGPWTARPVADNSARKKRTTRPVAESSACTFKYSLHFLSYFLLMLDETFLF